MMLAWNNVSTTHKALFSITLLAFIYVIILAPEDFPYSWVLLPLFLLTLISHYLEQRRERNRVEEQRENASIKEPRINGKAPVVEAPGLPMGIDFSLIDMETGDNLCRIERERLKELIERHREWGLEENDFLKRHRTPTILDTN